MDTYFFDTRQHIRCARQNLSHNRCKDHVPSGEEHWIRKLELVQNCLVEQNLRNRNELISSRSQKKKISIQNLHTMVQLIAIQEII